MTAYVDRVRRLGEGQPSLRVRARSRFEPVPPEAEPTWERSADAAPPPPPRAEAPVPGEHRRTGAGPWAAGSARQRPVPPDPAPGLPRPSAPDPAPGLPERPAGPSPGRLASRAAPGPRPHRHGNPGHSPARQTWPPRPTASVPRSQNATSQGRGATAGDAAARESTGRVRPPQPGRRRRSADEAGDQPAAARPAEAETSTAAAPQPDDAGDQPAAARPAEAEPGTAAVPQPDDPERRTSADARSRATYPSPRSARAATGEQDSRPSFAAAFPARPPELSGDGTAPQVRTGSPGLAGLMPGSGQADQVTVTIGRVDVRVGPPGPARPDLRPTAQGSRRATRPRPRRLEDYLRARAAGRVG
ncbi:MAG: hypothetical protein ACLP8X_01275 [Streptosporangiaceae bacterium]